jgi:hypothetical protein
LDLGIKPDVGPHKSKKYNVPENLADGRAGARIGSADSIFDPVVCELVYGWWCRPGGVVVDPFAGGSVRGIVASLLGRKYWGCELRPEQVEANRAQLNGMTCGTFRPHWVCGDIHDKLSEAPKTDLLFSCQPYGDLEKYSDDPADLSNMPYGEFLHRYREIIKRAARLLRMDRFACFVVANFRDQESGSLNTLVDDTVQAFKENDMRFYNGIVLWTPVGTAAMRSNQNFVRSGRKVVKVHQNLLVFVKGDPKKAAADIPCYAGTVLRGDGVPDGGEGNEPSS